MVEASQPFAARTLLRPADGVPVGELWLIASAGSDDGNEYLAAANARWDINAAIDQFSPDVGIRLWRLAADTEINLWASNLIDDALVVIQAPLEVEPQVLTNALEAWRRNAT